MEKKETTNKWMTELRAMVMILVMKMKRRQMDLVGAMRTKDNEDQRR